MTSSGSRSASVGSRRVHCYCGISASVCVSTKNKSKGRRFYGCRFYPDLNKYCGFFQWLDINSENAVHDSSCSENVSTNEDEVTLLRNKNKKLKEKLNNVKREALKLELESVRVGEANKKLQLYVLLSWMVTCVLLSYVLLKFESVK